MKTSITSVSAELSENGKKLAELWNGYALAGYENIYRMRPTKSHREKLGELFLPSNKGVYLDAGCGTGNMFELIVKKIKPAQLYAVDWSGEMLKKAKLEAERLRQNSEIDFKFYRKDVSKSLGWPDGFFDGVVSNQVISFIPYEWKDQLKELRRVTKLGGYLYLGTFLKGWGYTGIALWKHAPKGFFQDPIGSFYGLRYRRIVAKIDKEVRKRGAQFPPQQELISFLRYIGFEEIETIPTYFGGGLALRARLFPKPLS